MARKTNEVTVSPKGKEVKPDSARMIFWQYRTAVTAGTVQKDEVLWEAMKLAADSERSAAKAVKAAKLAATGGKRPRISKLVRSKADRIAMRKHLSVIRVFLASQGDYKGAGIAASLTVGRRTFDAATFGTLQRRYSKAAALAKTPEHIRAAEVRNVVAAQAEAAMANQPEPFTPERVAIEAAKRGRVTTPKGSRKAKATA